MGHDKHRGKKSNDTTNNSIVDEAQRISDNADKVLADLEAQGYGVGVAESCMA